MNKASLVRRVFGRTVAALFVSTLVFVTPAAAETPATPPAEDYPSIILPTPRGEVQPLLAQFASDWERGDWLAMEELVRNPVRLEEVPTGFTVEGHPSGLFKALAVAKSAFSDVTIDLTHGWEAEDFAVATGYFEGTYIGQLEGVPPGTGELIQFPFAAVFELEDGKISQIWLYYDLSRLLTSTGLMPELDLAPVGVLVGDAYLDDDATPMGS